MAKNSAPHPAKMNPAAPSVMPGVGTTNITKSISGVPAPQMVTKPAIPGISEATSPAAKPAVMKPVAKPPKAGGSAKIAMKTSKPAKMATKGAFKSEKPAKPY